MDRVKSNAAYYAKNREAQYARVKANQAKVRQHYLDWKVAGPCTDCGVSYPAWVMDADHVGKKRWNIAASLKLMGMNQLKSELEQCERVCSNCHRQRTHNRTSSFNSTAE